MFANILKIILLVLKSGTWFSKTFVNVPPRQCCPTMLKIRTEFFEKNRLENFENFHKSSR